MNMLQKTAARTTTGRGRLFDSILDTVGDTPTIRINNLGVPHASIYVKAEFFNPAASVKDRLALSIIEEAERSGALSPGQTVVEASSGNTGIGLAMVCAQKGYPLVVTMADSFSIERRKLMRMLGAKVVLTPRAQKGFGMYQKAVELAESNGWFLARQFETPANAAIHEATTAREIINDFAGSRLDCFVTGYGTGGTVAGVARVLRRERPETRIVLAEPANARLVGSGSLQARMAGGAPAASHPAFEPHPIQGWNPRLHSPGAAGGHRPQALRRGAADRRPGGHKVDAGARAAGGHLHRHLRRLHLRGGASGRRAGGGRIGDPLHPPRHRRALHVDAALRRHRGRNG
jgi:cysteine synthase A